MKFGNILKSGAGILALLSQVNPMHYEGRPLSREITNPRQAPIIKRPRRMSWTPSLRCRPRKDSVIDVPEEETKAVENCLERISQRIDSTIERSGTNPSDHTVSKRNKIYASLCRKYTAIITEVRDLSQRDSKDLVKAQTSVRIDRLFPASDMIMQGLIIYHYTRDLFNIYRYQELECIYYVMKNDSQLIRTIVEKLLLGEYPLRRHAHELILRVLKHLGRLQKANEKLPKPILEELNPRF